MHSQERVEFANILRGMAALLVLVGHYGDVFWHMRAAVAWLTFIPELSESVFATPIYLEWMKLPNIYYGRIGVGIFFLISGFVIPFSLARSTALSFAINRVLRIWPTYVAGLSFTLLVLWLGTRYTGSAWEVEPGRVLANYLPGLQDFSGYKSIDGIVWTLNVEMKFYFICALSLVLFRKKNMAIFLVPLGLTISASCLTYLLPLLKLSHPMLHGFLWPWWRLSNFLVFMYIGTALFYIYKGYLTKRQGYGITALLFGATLFLAYQTMPNQLISIIIDFGLALVIFVLSFIFRRHFVANRATSFFANISYPLYVIHGVAGYAVLQMLLYQGVKAWVSLVIVTLGAMGIAWLLHVLVEVPTQRMGGRISKAIYARWQMRQSAPLVAG